MRKTKTIEISACDFCGAEDVYIWTCEGCAKEACQNCCKRCGVEVKPPEPPPTTTTMYSSDFFGTVRDEAYLAIFCKDCGPKIYAQLLGFGFRDLKAKSKAA